jgi:hypothetical protein
MIAFCGLDCEQCESFQAMQCKDNQNNADIARRWNNLCGIATEDVVCTGCRSGGSTVRSCASACRIRQCAHHRRLASCSDCSDYPCPALQEIFDIVPQARQRLERIRDPRRVGDNT